MVSGRVSHLSDLSQLRGTPKHEGAPISEAPKVVVSQGGASGNRTSEWPKSKAANNAVYTSSERAALPPNYVVRLDRFSNGVATMRSEESSNQGLRSQRLAGNDHRLTSPAALSYAVCCVAESDQRARWVKIGSCKK